MGEAALRIIEKEFEHHEERAAKTHIDDELVRTRVALKNAQQLRNHLVRYNLRLRAVISFLNQKEKSLSYLEELKGETYQIEHYLEKINEWRKSAFKFGGPKLIENAIKNVKEDKFKNAVENLELLSSVIDRLKQNIDGIKTFLSSYERNLKVLDKKEIWPDMHSLASSIEKFLDKIQKEVCDFI